MGAIRFQGRHGQLRRTSRPMGLGCLRGLGRRRQGLVDATGRAVQAVCSSRATSSTSSCACSRRSPGTATRSSRSSKSRFGGSYAPSPGTVYPTLTMLEDLGYARVVPEEGGKKIYEITDEGRKYLAEHSTTVDDIFERIAQFVEGFTDTPMMELNQSFQRLARATYKTATCHIGDKGDDSSDSRHHPTRRRRDRGSRRSSRSAAAGRVIDGALDGAGRAVGEALDLSNGSRISFRDPFLRSRQSGRLLRATTRTRRDSPAARS